MRSGMAVGKIAWRLQVGPTIKTLKILNRRPNRPGMHGARKFSTKSVFGRQLLEKQKLRFQFMITERTLRRAYQAASSKKGSTGENLLQLLDSRLDAVIFRSGVVRSILAARQLVTHHHIFVNGRRVDKPSFQVSESDVISFSAKAKAFAFLQEGFRDGICVPYISLDKEAFTMRRAVQPTRDAIPVLCSEQMIVEFYSR